ncbi:garvicin Q family class II bacteriocin, partial [Lactococcus lactis]|uniref:garvicin Q family class II bacteriocin n=1 Tax=Lactococcus lactis TaxID=1358 RepID=UPI002880A5E9
MVDKKKVPTPKKTLQKGSQFTKIMSGANGYLAYDNWNKKYVYHVTKDAISAVTGVIANGWGSQQVLELVLKQGDLQESCDVMEKFNIENDQEFLEILYNYALNPNIKERERKIVQLGRKDLEKKVYSLSVANKMV